MRVSRTKAQIAGDKKRSETMKAKKAAKARVEGLLSAPDSVLKNAAELRKYRQRKAREAQAAEMLKASKSSDRPSIEDFIEDIHRVAGDQELNPMGWRFKSISRGRYQQYGRYPLQLLQEEFGTFAHVLEVCGLRDTPGTRKRLSARAEASRQSHAQRYYDRYVMPYVLNRDQFAARQLTETRILLSISDTHSTFLDPFTWQCFLAAIRDLQMGEDDVVLFNGDTMEGGEISSHPKIPGWSVTIQVEFDFQREMVKQVRATGFEGHIIMVGGNHGIDRWARYLSQEAAALTSLRCLKIDKLMGLDEFNVEIVQGGTIMSPDGTEGDAPGLVLYDFYRIHHGTKLGQTPALSELVAAGRSGQSGHTHRAMMICGTTETTAGMSWMSTPMGCNKQAGRAYMKGTNFGWQMGFGIAFLSPGGIVRQWPVLTDGGRCHIEGHIYERIADLADPSPDYNWLPDLPVLEAA